jgi:hypothetical protein
MGQVCIVWTNLPGARLFVMCGQGEASRRDTHTFIQIKAELVRHIIAAIQVMYTDNPKTSPDYSRIISERHFKYVGSDLFVNMM